ncbi:MAG TPA: hypothetical protein VGE07_17925 [Herpetosiphonaceae bacterium]
MFSHAIVRPPAPTYADGLTSVSLGAPDFDLALEQHERYCAALERCGLELIRLAPDPAYPDSTFVEDTAILAAGGAIVTRPGAPSRAGEVAAIREALARRFGELAEIAAPGTLDGGDICEADGHVFIGLSARTNEEGARQLADWLAARGLGSSTVDIRGRGDILHLKSGIAYLGERRLALISSLAGHEAFRGYEIVEVADEESYGANCVRVNDAILVASGHPRLNAALRGLGYELIELDMSEYRKQDGGLSCLSLRF